MLVRTAVELSAYMSNGTCTKWHWCTFYLRTLDFSPISSSATFSFVITDCYIGPICRYEGAKGIHVTPSPPGVESSWNVMAHDVREGKWRGNWRMEWVASTLHTTSEHGVSSITAADAHTSAASGQVTWRPHRLARFAETRSLFFFSSFFFFFRVCHHLSNAVCNFNGNLLSAEFFKLLRVPEDRGSTVAKALCYKSEDRWFDSRWCHWNFSLTVLPIALWPWSGLSL